MSDADRDTGAGVRQGLCPFRPEAAPSRRAMLLGAGVAGAALVAVRPATAQEVRDGTAGTVPAGDHAISAQSLAADHGHDAAPHDFDNDGTREAQPFHGAHQSGVVNPQPATAVIAAFDVLASDAVELRKLMRDLTRRISSLMKGGAVAPGNPRMPPSDNLVLGPDVFPDNLTITVGVGASLFDARYGLADAKPKHLAAMEQFPNDALETDFCHGDLLLQFCSNTAETNIHALREIIRMAPDALSLRWKMDGFLPPHTLKKLGKDTIRNLMGFKDGTANIDAADASLMDRLVWAGDGEADWARGGTYQVVRLIRMLVERWDRTPLREQQTIFGRDKASGAPLGMANERDVPDFRDDRQGRVIPMDAHIRLANPRTPETQSSLILRRPYNYSRDVVTKAGQLDMGLAFICFQANLDAGFRSVQARLNGEPLEEYIRPFGGGYFFVLPGVRDERDYFAKALLERLPERGPA